MPPATSNLPRADVSTGALAGALVGILMLVLNGGATVAALAPLLTIVAQVGIEYLWPTRKVEAGALAGAIMVVGVHVYVRLTTGQIVDEATFNAAAVYIVTLILTAVLPPVQPGEPRMGQSR